MEGVKNEVMIADISKKDTRNFSLRSVKGVFGLGDPWQDNYLLKLHTYRRPEGQVPLYDILDGWLSWNENSEEGLLKAEETEKSKKLSEILSCDTSPDTGDQSKLVIKFKDPEELDREFKMETTLAEEWSTIIEGYITYEWTGTKGWGENLQYRQDKSQLELGYDILKIGKDGEEEKFEMKEVNVLRGTTRHRLVINTDKSQSCVFILNTQAERDDALKKILARKISHQSMPELVASYTSAHQKTGGGKRRSKKKRTKKRRTKKRTKKRKKKSKTRKRR